MKMAEEFFHVLGENDTIIRFKKNDKQELRHVDTVKAIKTKGNKRYQLELFIPILIF